MEGHTAAFYVLTDPGLEGLEVLKLKRQHPKPQTKHGSFGLKEQPWGLPTLSSHPHPPLSTLGLLPVQSTKLDLWRFLYLLWEIPFPGEVQLPWNLGKTRLKISMPRTPYPERLEKSPKRLYYMIRQTDRLHAHTYIFHSSNNTSFYFFL